jgi:aspartate-semialdehyde dehydrogenase
MRLGIIGATGAVGQELLKCIEERNFPFTELVLLASSRSAGTKIDFMGKTYTVEETTENSFDNLDMALFAGGPASRAFGRLAQSKGVVVIDNSSTFRMDDDVPLVVPEVNPEALDNHKGLIANPNCSTIIMAAAIYPIHQYANIKRVIVSTYQAVSGAGKEGIDELEEQIKQVLNGEATKPEVFAKQIAFNVVPRIDVWVDEDYTKEEMKMVWETQKIFGVPNLAITATTVRVPVFRSHSESIYIETEKPIDADKAREILKNAPGVILQDDPENEVYPTPLETSTKDEVFVGRIRNDLYTENALNMWVVSDQIKKGAALNTVQIAEEMIKRNLI